MTAAVERKFVNLRKRLDQLGYRQPLGVESLPLVEKLFSDLVHTTESLRSTKLSAGKIEKECSNFDVVLGPYREENARLTRENNELHLEVLKLKEQFEKQELSSYRREKEKLSEELFGKTEEKQNLDILLNQTQVENHRLSKKVENLEIINRELVIELERMRLEGGIALGDKSPSRLDAFVKTIEEDRDYYKRELECLQKIFKRRSSPLSEDLRLVIRERDELQSMLDRFEKHMIEIQSNVKLLTVEKDKLSILYEQSQNELNHLRREKKTCFLTKNHAEEERNIALADFRRVVSEKEGLREKLKIQQEEYTLDKLKLEQEVSRLESTLKRLETERLDQISTVSLLKDKISSLEDELSIKTHQLLNTSEDSSQYKTELSSLKLLNEQIQKSLDEIQHQLSFKENELQSAQEEIEILENKIDTLNTKSSSQSETVILLRSTVNALDKEKDSLQESIDEKTERIAYLEDNLANKEKTLLNLQKTVAQLELSLDQLKDALNGKDRELASLHRQFDAIHSELGETGRIKEMALKENRRLQDDLATMTRENQVISTELEVTLREKEELKVRVHNYITEVSRFESLMSLKERENKELLEKFQMLHSQAEDWEVKAHQAEGQNSSVRLELLSIDTERRHLRERVELLEKEIQEHIIAHQTYESQISSMAKNMSKLEEILRREKEEKSSINHDVSAVRDLCVKLESSKDLVSRQLTSKSLEFERIVSEFEDAKAEGELLKKQLSSERLTIQNLETLLATSRDNDFQNHLITHEKDSEIQLLKDKLTLSESKLTSLSREVSILRNKLAQL
ncbi:centrosomal protein of 135 kDa, partial [Protobothrops mucrosquamatus]|uniref:centrosomal protein of 135 kDa n=1 Tax=Protobothrops mucrosquamatus TaxID=103944 RepID=UPI000775EE07